MTTAIILAGGLGTRLRKEVPNLPKPMAPVRGRPFLEYQMDYWIEQGVTQFIISVGYLKEIIMDHFGSSYRSIPLRYAIEYVPLGTGGGLLLATRGITGNFLVLNGDTFFAVPLKELLEFHLQHQSEWTFSLFRSYEDNRYLSLSLGTGNRVLPTISRGSGTSYLANGGIYMMNASVFFGTNLEDESRFSLEEDLLTAFLDRGGVPRGREFSGNFIDIGLPHEYFRAPSVLPTRG